MTKQEKLEAIRGVCIAANSDIERPAGRGRHGDFLVEDRPVRLADILLAIEKTKEGTEVAIDTMGEFRMRDRDGYHETQQIWWNLYKDNINDQSDEFINFAYSLLVPNK